MTIFHAAYEAELRNVSQEILSPEEPAIPAMPLELALNERLLQAVQTCAAGVLSAQTRQARLMHGIGETEPERLAADFAAHLLSEGPHGDYPMLSRFLHMIRTYGADVAPRAMALLLESYLVLLLGRVLRPAQ